MLFVLTNRPEAALRATLFELFVFLPDPLPPFAFITSSYRRSYSRSASFFVLAQ
jgi:hypothetical protein